jgi:Ulp1 family protease
MKKLVYPSRLDVRAVSISAKDLECLVPKKLVNDEVVDFWGTYLRTHLIPEWAKTLWKKQGPPPSFQIASSFFATKARKNDPNVEQWFKFLEIESYDYTLVPYHAGLHWKLLVVKRREHLISLLDSCNDFHDEDKLYDFLFSFLFSFSTFLMFDIFPFLSLSSIITKYCILVYKKS